MNFNKVVPFNGEDVDEQKEIYKKRRQERSKAFTSVTLGEDPVLNRVIGADLIINRFKELTKEEQKNAIADIEYHLENPSFKDMMQVKNLIGAGTIEIANNPDKLNEFQEKNNVKVRMPGEQKEEDQQTCCRMMKNGGLVKNVKMSVMPQSSMIMKTTPLLNKSMAMAKKIIGV